MVREIIWRFKNGSAEFPIIPVLFPLFFNCNIT